MKHSIFILAAFLIFSACSKKASDGAKMVMEIKDGWTMAQSGESKWYPATVPGCVHTDLFNNKVIPDPFYRTNENDLQWIDKKDWDYQSSFNIKKELLDNQNVELVFKGLDTYADVYLNDSLLLSANNMFREWRKDAKKLLKEGENKIKIHFRSPINETEPIYDKQGYILPANNDQGVKRVSVFTRKAPYHYGWDWGPRFVTSGIWRPIFIEAWNNAKINNIQLVQNSLDDNSAKLSGVLEIQATTETNAKVKIFQDGNTAETDVKLKPGVNTVSVDFEIKNPKRWWPNGLGEPNLYQIKAELIMNGATKDSISSRIGLRTVELKNEADSIGKSFTFIVNGQPVFMKGANYIPSDNFLNRVTKEKYRALIKAAKDANMNMLRVWGGGIYEEDTFYDMADEMGILLWQDFIFGCSMYPGDSAFLNNVREEAAYNVKRMRNHPSIAMWCGNNEMDEAWHTWGWQKTWNINPKDSAYMWQSYVKIFHEILPEAVKKYDAQRFYWPSSPSIGFRDPRSFKSGDNHYWGVWHEGKPFAEFKTHIGRFMSEYGFQSFPELKTIKSYTIPEDWNIDSTVMKAHQRHPRGNALIREYTLRDYKKPKDFESFLYVGQVLQAEGIKTAVECHRRAMPYCMGTLYWQHDDCWPVASWSSMDYFLRWKAQHYFMKKSYNDILISPTEDNGTFSLFVVSDRWKETKSKVKYTLMDFSGKVLFEETKDYTAPANTSAAVIKMKTKEFLKGNNPKNVFLNTSIWDGDKMLSGTTFYFAPVKDLALPKPVISVKISGTIVELSTDKLAKNVYLTTPDNIDGSFSDNYFDLIPGQTVKIEFTSKSGAVDLNNQVTARSIVDTY